VERIRHWLDDPGTPRRFAGETSGHVRDWFGVADVDAFYAKCTAAGVVATSPPADLHVHRIAGLRDMDGAEFSVSR